MSTQFKKIAEDTFWIGKIDNRQVPFHRLVLSKGTTYNSYLLKTGKPTVIDTVDMEFGREYAECLGEMIDLLDIHYIVINHTEPDHLVDWRRLLARLQMPQLFALRLPYRNCRKCTSFIAGTSWWLKTEISWISEEKHFCLKKHRTFILLKR